MPLTDAALAIVTEIERRDRDYVFGRTRNGGFSGWSKSKAEFDELVKLKETWTVHDLRRTVALASVSSAFSRTLLKRH